MKLKLRFLGLSVIATVILIVPACNRSGSEVKNNDSLTVQTDDTNDIKIFYQVPSPEDMFAFTDEGTLKYSNSVLNPVENSSKYIDTRAKELNFGVYSADMAYSANFSKYQESIKYLNVVRSLSEDIGIASVFDESLVKRIDNIMNSKDSLKRVSSDTYYDIVRFLEQKDRKRTLVLIATGGWIESIYIVVNTVEYSENSKLIQLVADQKNIINNLMSTLEQQKSDEAVSATIKELTPVKNIYNELTVEKIEKPKQTDDDKIIIGGSSKIKMTKEQFLKLKESLSKVRNNITANNVTL